MPALNDPLSQFPAIRTSQLDEFEHQLRAIYGATGFELRNPAELRSRGNFAQMQDIALGFGTCGTSATIQFANDDFARLQLPLRGNGRTRSGKQETAVAPGSPSLTSPGRPSILSFGVGFEHLFLRVSSQSLRRRLALLLGAPIRRELEFELTRFASPEMQLGLQCMVELLVQQLDGEYGSISPLALQEMEQAVTLQLLFASRHNFSPMLDGDPQESGPVPVRLAEGYIEANWSRPILVEALVEVAGVSARSLYRSFEKTHGCSPIVFVRRIRLHHARDLLTGSDEATSVTSVALACGFSNMGHFARDYRRAFGELPSETLRVFRLR